MSVEYSWRTAFRPWRALSALEVTHRSVWGIGALCVCRVCVGCARGRRQDRVIKQRQQSNGWKHDSGLKEQLTELDQLWRLLVSSKHAHPGDGGPRAESTPRQHVQAPLRATHSTLPSPLLARRPWPAGSGASWLSASVFHPQPAGVTARQRRRCVRQALKHEPRHATHRAALRRELGTDAVLLVRCAALRAPRLHCKGVKRGRTRERMGTRCIQSGSCANDNCRPGPRRGMQEAGATGATQQAASPACMLSRIRTYSVSRDSSPAWARDTSCHVWVSASELVQCVLGGG